MLETNPNEENIEFHSPSAKSSITTSYSNTYHKTLPDTSLPLFKKDLSSHISNLFLLKTFSKACKSFNFLITEQTPSSCTAFNTQTCSFKSFLLRCLGKSHTNITSCAKLIIGINPNTNLRTIYIKGILGNIDLLTDLIDSFKKHLEKGLKSIEKVKYERIVEESEENEITCKAESICYYEIFKILSTENYSLGKSVSEFFKVFASQYRSPSESSQLIPQPLLSIQSQIESTIESLFSHYNYGKKSTLKLLTHSRPAVEKFFFTKLYPHLLEIYKHKYLPEDNSIKKLRLETNSLKKEQVMEKLGINEKFWTSEEEIFQESIALISKVGQCVTLIDKLNIFSEFQVSIKMGVLQWNGEEIEYEDFVRLAMYVLLKSQWENPYAETMIVKDYVEGKYEEEGRSVVRDIQSVLAKIVDKN